MFAQDAALAALAAKLQSELAAERAAAEARATRERIAKVLAGATPSLEQWRAAAKDLAALLAGDAKDPETLALRSRLIEALRAQLQAATTTRDFDALAAWLHEPAQPLAADRAYAELLAALPGLRSKVAAAEQARLEAERGELVLNAYPWGNVEAVQDANRQPVTLPADTSTPLVLTLPAGSYRITFRHPQAAKPVQVIAKVEARKRVVASASFPTISAREYFARAGW